MARMEDMQKYEILYDLPEGAYADRGVGAIRTKTIRAGDSLEVEAFPLICADSRARSEAQRRRATPAQEKLNLENSRKRTRRLMEANFGKGDWVVHLTYDYGFVDRAYANMRDVIAEWQAAGIPMDDAEAERNARNYIRRIKTRARRKGADPKAIKYMYVTESTCEPNDDDLEPLPAHYHHHIVISGLDVLCQEDFVELWQYGYVDAKLLDLRYNGLEALAKYIVKQPGRKKHYRRLRTSRNLKQPEIRVSDRKISRRRAALIAEDVRANGKEIFERIYPGYALVDCLVKYSDFVAGAYIYARMRRIETATVRKNRTAGSKRRG